MCWAEGMWQVEGDQSLLEILPQQGNPYSGDRKVRFPWSFEANHWKSVHRMNGLTFSLAAILTLAQCWWSPECSRSGGFFPHSLYGTSFSRCARHTDRYPWLHHCLMKAHEITAGLMPLHPLDIVVQTGNALFPRRGILDKFRRPGVMNTFPGCRPIRKPLRRSRPSSTAQLVGSNILSTIIPGAPRLT